jgi:phospholipid-binding lipoprotein MlaA
LKNIILIILITFLFNACATKEPTNNVTSNQKVEVPSIQENAQDDSEDEFEEEFGDETIEVFDPLSGYNRVMTSFNDTVYINVFNPVATGYSNVLPKSVRVGFANFFDNLLFPVRFVNNLLQLKFHNSVEELGRFLINTTFGLGGFMDPAKKELGWVQHKEDFGQTLGFYGVGDAVHIVLPLLGPSNLRDMFGLVGDSYLSPTSSTGASDLAYKIPDSMIQSTAISATDRVNSVSLNLGQYEAIKKDALDLYPYFRDVYNQVRKKQIEE